MLTGLADHLGLSKGEKKRKKKKKKTLEPALGFCHLVGGKCAQISIVHDRDVQNPACYT